MELVDGLAEDVRHTAPEEALERDVPAQVRAARVLGEDRHRDGVEDGL